jgi:hypothetical protein
MLDVLESRGHLKWIWGYANSRAIYNILFNDGSHEACDIKEAEYVAIAKCEALGICWRPVAYPGGEDQLKLVARCTIAGCQKEHL